MSAPRIGARLRARLRSPAPSVRRNVVANFFATGWLAVLGIVVVPLNVQFLGIEGYALIGVYTIVQALALLLDAGLSPTLNRELARLSAVGDSRSEMRTLVRTLELVYWGVAIVVGALIVGLAPVAATHWLHPVRLSVGEVERALVFMGLTIAIQWPASLYAGGLQGLQHQVEWSVGTMVIGTLRSVGGILILWLVSPTVTAFFAWQLAIAALWTIWLFWFLWRLLPSGDGHRARFDGATLRGVWRFAAGAGGVTVTAMVLSQADKVILSHMLPLVQFGYYSLAAALAAVFGRTVEPIFYAFFPRFSELVGRGEQARLAATYHRACQLASVILLPAAVVLAVFSQDVLRLWTHDPVIAREARWLVTLLVAGTALNRLWLLPYALQLAHGWTRLAVWHNVIAVIIALPALVFAASRWGTIGAASVWVALNMAYVLVQIPLMHRRLLVGEVKRWYVEDVAAPLLAAGAVALPGALIMRTASYPIGVLAIVVVTSAASLLAGVVAVPWLRSAFVRRLVRARFATQA